MKKLASLAYPSAAIYEENERHWKRPVHISLVSGKLTPSGDWYKRIRRPCMYVSEEMSERVIVGVKQGDLRGRKVSTKSGLHYCSFQGIPYAKPPVGNLRFQVSCSYVNFILIPKSDSRNLLKYNFRKFFKMKKCLKVLRISYVAVKKWLNKSRKFSQIYKCRKFKTFWIF